ncbi:hypothetical protein TRFO_29283 [Tritrichomonas foetus]|uniref:RRM domain-containing protein n=1 Tax=Tritrichomonas foetus TaxID=1144522 RepID=A0A1J4K0P2_9EUKA|nr:hypothetical protein TRFO_29283 [Tritrichomonas foetus]|eukprot:OHT03310.1 hypothetical protein TRFO_29283 [Tritrichomonas foetus]
MKKNDNPEPNRPPKECPLCINELTNNEYDFYPCPCGYQVCAFCFQRLCEQENQRKCAKCRRPFDPDAEKRIGPQFKPVETTTSTQKLVVNYYIAPKIVQIVGIPDSLLSTEKLRQTAYFGQYGPIEKISIEPSTAPSAKTVLANVTKPVFVKFRSPKDAETCILSMDGIQIGNQPISASIAVVEQCPKILTGRTCNKRACLKRHRQERQSDEVVPAAEIDSKDSGLKKRINPQRPNNYSLYPKRAHCITVFPPPRLAPPVYFPFQHSRIYAKKPPLLFDLVMAPGGIPPASCPRMPPEPIPLSRIFNLE